VVATGGHVVAFAGQTVETARHVVGITADIVGLGVAGFAEAKASSVVAEASPPAWAVARTRPKQAVVAIPAQKSLLRIPHLL
jgi:hypothetical protein